MVFAHYAHPPMYFTSSLDYLERERYTNSWWHEANSNFSLQNFRNVFGYFQSTVSWIYRCRTCGYGRPTILHYLIFVFFFVLTVVYPCVLGPISQLVCGWYGEFHLLWEDGINLTLSSYSCLFPSASSLSFKICRVCSLFGNEA